MVEDVVVRQEYRGQGIGRLLLEHLRAWAKKKKISRLQLLADRNNRAALDFYAQLGWKNTKLICLRKHEN